MNCAQYDTLVLQTSQNTLTATSTKKVKGDIMEHLQIMEDNTDVIFNSPDRPNIFLEIVKKESTEYETCLSWLIEHIRVKGRNSKKTVIYCRSIDSLRDFLHPEKLSW